MVTFATLCFLEKNGKVLLIRKKVGFGKGKLNGVGGRIEVGESPVEAAIREGVEEVSVKILELEPAGKLEFYSTNDNPDWVVYIYRSKKFEGEPKPSEEAEPQWYDIESLPYCEMWEDDRVWLPQVLAGKTVEGKFWFDKDYQKILRWEVKVY
ncbi:MAG: 8-oxo-dGTP diphosphatase [Thermofilaceae archaeon]